MDEVKQREAGGPTGTVVSSAVVHQWQCDHFGHLNVRNYAAIFDDAIFIFWGRCGFRHGEGVAPVSAEIKLSFRHELLAGSVVNLSATPIRIGSKSATIRFMMLDAETGSVVAEAESAEVFFDLRNKQTVRIPELIRNRLEDWEKLEDLSIKG